MLKSLRNPTDSVEDYITQYGYFGQALYEGVQKERQTSMNQQIQIQQRPSVQMPQVCIILCITVRLFWSGTVRGGTERETDIYEPTATDTPET